MTLEERRHAARAAQNAQKESAARQYVARASRNAQEDFFRLQEARERERREKALAERPRWNDYPVLLRMTNEEAETLLAAVLQRLSTTAPSRPFSAAELSEAARLTGSLIRAGKVADGRPTTKRFMAAVRRHADLRGTPEKGTKDFAVEQLNEAYWSPKLEAILKAQKGRR